MNHHDQDLTEVTSLEFLDILDTSISSYIIGIFETKEVSMSCGVDGSAMSLTPTSNFPEASKIASFSILYLLLCAWL